VKTGVVLLSHGSRAAVDEANQLFLQLAGLVKQQLEYEIFTTAFMNPRSQRPNLEQAVGKAVREGAERVIVVPVFFFNGLHMQQDIPREIKRLSEKYRVRIDLTGPLGTDPRIADIIVEKIKEVG